MTPLTDTDAETGIHTKFDGEWADRRAAYWLLTKSWNAKSRIVQMGLTWLLAGRKRLKEILRGTNASKKQVATWRHTRILKSKTGYERLIAMFPINEDLTNGKPPVGKWTGPMEIQACWDAMQEYFGCGRHPLQDWLRDLEDSWVITRDKTWNEEKGHYESVRIIFHPRRLIELMKRAGRITDLKPSATKQKGKKKKLFRWKTTQERKGKKEAAKREAPSNVGEEVLSSFSPCSCESVGKKESFTSTPTERTFLPGEETKSILPEGSAPLKSTNTEAPSAPLAPLEPLEPLELSSETKNILALLNHIFNNVSSTPEKVLRRLERKVHDLPGWAITECKIRDYVNMWLDNSRSPDNYIFVTDVERLVKNWRFILKRLHIEKYGRAALSAAFDLKVTKEDLLEEIDLDSQKALEDAILGSQTVVQVVQKLARMDNVGELVKWCAVKALGEDPLFYFKDRVELLSRALHRIPRVHEMLKDVIPLRQWANLKLFELNRLGRLAHFAHWNLARQCALVPLHEVF